MSNGCDILIPTMHRVVRGTQGCGNFFFLAEEATQLTEEIECMTHSPTQMMILVFHTPVGEKDAGKG